MILYVQQEQQQEPEQEEEEEQQQQQEQEFTWIAAASQASPCIPSLCTMALGCRLNKYHCIIVVNIITIITIHIIYVILFLLSIATKLRSTAFDNGVSFLLLTPTGLVCFLFYEHKLP